MSKFQKAVSVVLSLCFFAVLAGAPEPAFLWKNVYRHLPLYCFVEKEAERIPAAGDRETSEQIIEKNSLYLAQAEKKEEPEQDARESSREDPGSGSVKEEPVEQPEKKAREESEEKEGAVSEENPVSAEKSGDESVIIKDAEDGSASIKKTEEDPASAERSGKEFVSAEISEEKSVSEEESEEDPAMEKELEEDPVSEEELEEDPATEKESEEEPVSEEESEEDPAMEKESEEESVSEAESEENPADDSVNAEEEEEALPKNELSLEKLEDFDYLIRQFYIVDPGTVADPELFSAKRFLEADMTLAQDPSAPQILIYHSHSQEAFADSREGETEDTIVGVGNYLTELLTENYGYQVLHVTETFDIINGEVDRSQAYDYAGEYVGKLLEENPSIEVVIDLHRDGVPDDRRLVTEIGGKPTAQIMFFNGLSFTAGNGVVEELPNPYIQENLAFSFQLEYQAAMYYPDLYRGIYLAGLRYNLHLRPKALLLEAGAQTNTVQEVKNAMEPFADILHKVLSP